MIGGMVADIDQGCARPVGDLAPSLYSFGSEFNLYGYALNDITAGDNDFTWAISTRAARVGRRRTGYDLRERPRDTRCAGGLACPEVTSSVTAQRASRDRR